MIQMNGQLAYSLPAAMPASSAENFMPAWGDTGLKTTLWPANSQSMLRLSAESAQPRSKRLNLEKNYPNRLELRLKENISAILPEQRDHASAGDRVVNRPGMSICHDS